jgi:membrane fusion protein (multidrug efflux system)
MPTATAPPDPAKRRRRRGWLLAIAALLLTVLILGGIKAAQIGAMVKAGKSFVPPPTAVSSAEVKRDEWPTIRTGVGSIVSVQGTRLGSELPGIVVELGFESGDRVSKGDMLVKLDTSTEQAQLSGAIADRRLAEANLERLKTLQTEGIASKAELDAAVARASQAGSAIGTLRTAIAKKTIRAPFQGRVGIRQVELGQLIAPGTAVASLQSIDPMYLEFQLPQQALATVKEGQQVKVTVDVFNDKSWTGRITTINPEVDPQTRNVRIRATVPNRDGTLTPGMFAEVEVLSGVKNEVVVIPATSVLSAPYGDSVYLIEDGKDPAGKPAQVVRQQFIRTGERRGDFVVVTSGLEPGQRVVSSGAFKLRNGMAVAINDALAPPASLQPTPPNN